VFSLGIVVYRLSYNGIHPFFDGNNVFKSFEQYFSHVAKVTVKYPNYPKRSEELVTLISRML
jgi:hypothetical protein